MACLALGANLDKKKSRRLLRGFLSALLLCLPTRLAGANQHRFGIALGALEEGDERLRPEWIARWHMHEYFETELHGYGRQQGRVVQNTLMLTGAFTARFLGSRWLWTRAGLAIVQDQTVLSPTQGGRDARFSYNGGPYFGLKLQSQGRLTASVDWSHAQFLAGSAGIFLATARRQSFSLGIGWLI